MCCEQLRMRDAQLRSARQAMRKAKKELYRIADELTAQGATEGMDVADVGFELDLEASRRAGAAFSTPKNPVKTVKPK